MAPEESKPDANPPLFSAGALRGSAEVMRAIPPDEVLSALGRHLNGDWGDVEPDDWQASDQALAGGGRLLSVYNTAEGVKFYVITEADRSATTVILPEDY